MNSWTVKSGLMIKGLEISIQRHVTRFDALKWSIRPFKIQSQFRRADVNFLMYLMVTFNNPDDIQTDNFRFRDAARPYTITCRWLILGIKPVITYIVHVTCMRIFKIWNRMNNSVFFAFETGCFISRFYLAENREEAVFHIRYFLLVSRNLRPGDLL